MKIINKIPFRFKYSFRLFLNRFKKNRYFTADLFLPSQRRIFIFLAADYSNLGDVAITYAQTKFLEKYSNSQVIEIPISKSIEGLLFVKRHIRSQDIVTTVGGGNMGEMYDQIEFIRQLVFEFFPKNKIVSFPQTFDFSGSDEGLKALSRAKNIYSKHSNLVLVAREQKSFDLMRENFIKNKILLTPDIVLSLNRVDPKEERKGCVLCLRKDNEKSLTSHENQEVIDLINANFANVSFYDTHINKGNLSLFERNFELEKIWKIFKSSELVVTDRLHGMIFCYITNTPCIVFQNNNHKVAETYKWISEKSNIILMDSFSKEKFLEAINSLTSNDYRDLDIQYANLIAEFNYD